MPSSHLPLSPPAFARLRVYWLAPPPDLHHTPECPATLCKGRTPLRSWPTRRQRPQSPHTPKKRDVFASPHSPSAWTMRLLNGKAYLRGQRKIGCNWLGAPPARRIARA